MRIIKEVAPHRAGMHVELGTYFARISLLICDLVWVREIEEASLCRCLGPPGELADIIWAVLKCPLQANYNRGGGAWQGDNFFQPSTLLST